MSGMTSVAWTGSGVNTSPPKLSWKLPGMRKMYVSLTDIATLSCAFRASRSVTERSTFTCKPPMARVAVPPDRVTLTSPDESWMLIRVGSYEVTSTTWLNCISKRPVFMSRVKEVSCVPFPPPMNSAACSPLSSGIGTIDSPL